MKENKIKENKLKDIKVKNIKIKDIKVFFARTLLAIQLTLLKVIKFIKDNRKNPVINYIFPVWDELINKKIYMYKNTIQTLKNKNDMEIMREIEKENKDFEKIGKLKKKQAKYTIKGKNTLPKICWCEKVFLGFWLFRTPTRIFYLIFVTLRCLTLVKCPTSDLILTNSFRIFFKNTLFLLLHYFIVTMQISKRVENEESWEIFIWMDYEVNFDRLEREYYAAIDGTLRWAREEEYQQGNDENNNNFKDLSDLEGAFINWKQKYFPQKKLEIVKNDSKNEYITKFTFNVPLDLEIAEVERNISSFQRYCKKEILLEKTDMRDSEITLYLQRKELEKMLNLNESKIDKSSDTKVYVGEAFDGAVYLDFDDFPHMLIGGSSGCGKGVVQNVILLQLTQKGEVVIMDLSTKAGADYNYYRDKGYRIVTELEETLDFFKELQNEAKRRMEIFKAKGVNKISAYNKKVSEEEKIYRKFVLIDEYASLKRVDKEDEEEAKEIEKTIIALGEQARAVGIHIIIATQNAKSTIINTELRNNLLLRVVGSCADGNASNIFLENDFASIKREPPLIHAEDKGRFIVSGAKTKDRLDFNNHLVIQVPFVEFAGDMADEHIQKYGYLVEPPKISKMLENDNLAEQEIDENKINVNVKVDDEGEENIFNAKKIF